MDIRTTVRGVEDAAELRTYVEDKLASGLKRHDSRVLSAAVRLEDETGPRKNTVDKVCGIMLKLRTGEVRVRETGTDFYAVIDLALNRLRAALGRHVGKTKRGVGAG